VNFLDFKVKYFIEHLSHFAWLRKSKEYSELSMMRFLILNRQMASFRSVEHYGWLGLQRYYPVYMSVLLIAYSVTA